MIDHRRLYWVCQLGGWFSMVAIETINYTFFIVGKFNIEYFRLFVEYAVAGLLLTHLFRYILKRKDLFHRQPFSIWVTAIFSTFLISTLITLGNFLPSIIDNSNAFFHQVRFIDIAGTIINWMRYVGVWVIIYFMYNILKQNSAITQEKLALENLAKTTELELLKTQLNPHFLFNALNSIKALVTIDPEQCKDGIVKLSELLRFTLQYGRERLIPVNDELAEVKKYLELEQLRFGERLKVLFEIDVNTLSQTIPPAIVLTLAENAIKHGVAKYAGSRMVKVIAKIADGALMLTIANTGIYEPDALTGIGLQHVTKRLLELYHGRSKFLIGNVDGQVEATIQIPL